MARGNSTRRNLAPEQISALIRGDEKALKEQAALGRNAAARSESIGLPYGAVSLAEFEKMVSNEPSVRAEAIEKVAERSDALGDAAKIIKGLEAEALKGGQPNAADAADGKTAVQPWWTRKGGSGFARYIMSGGSAGADVISQAEKQSFQFEGRLKKAKKALALLQKAAQQSIGSAPSAPSFTPPASSK